MSIDTTKAAKLALFAIIIAVVIRVGAGQSSFRDEIEVFDFFNDLNRKGQVCNPGATRLFVLEIKLGGTGIMQSSLRAQIVVNDIEQVRFLALAKVVIPLALGRVEFAEDQAGGAVAVNVGELDLAGVIPFFWERDLDGV